MTLYVFQKGRNIKYILKTIKLNALLVERMFSFCMFGTLDQLRCVFLIQYMCLKRNAINLFGPWAYLKCLLRGYGCMEMDDAKDERDIRLIFQWHKDS